MGFVQGTGLDGGVIVEVLSPEGLTKPMPTCAWGILSDTFLFNRKKNFHSLGFSDRQSRLPAEGTLGVVVLYLNYAAWEKVLSSLSSEPAANRFQTVMSPTSCIEGNSK